MVFIHRMFRLPGHCHNVSLRLSEVLDDIGVNERLVIRRRRSTLLQETSVSFLSGNSVHIFGSKSEGTTTIGLHSDTDQLTALHPFIVIQDYAEWKRGFINLLMIQDDNTSPGYCHLQFLRPDMPLPTANIFNEHCCQDAQGRILMKNTACDNVMFTSGLKNGPAWTIDRQAGFTSTDTVPAVSCESWPNEARDWSQRVIGKWPTEDMKRYIENSGCFVVPVASKLSQTEHLEWRISTSKAERCLMYNLNITQIRCYVLLKMILKTYLQHPVSSYMCKTVLLHCIEKTNYNMWQENNLLTCLTVCLQALHTSILHKSCPHYFITGNNLMAGQFSTRMKDKLLESLHLVLESQGSALYGIQIDDLGKRLEIKMNRLYQFVQSTPVLSANVIILHISGSTIFNVARPLSDWVFYFLKIGDNHLRSPLAISDILAQAILLILRLYRNGTNRERKTLQLLVPFYCSSLGSVLASVNIGTNHCVSPEALSWLSAGLNSDVSSGRLKLASVLYCAGDMLRAESILRETERLYHMDSVQHICACYKCALKRMRKKCCRICYIQSEKAIKRACAFCVKFFPAEMNCIPRELQYELFRSTGEKLRNDVANGWMKMAVVDSLPFLFFLQYKTYGNLQRYNDQQRCLENLALTINLNEDFGHRETALNLLGQCMEQENRLNDALICYKTSLHIRGRNNVAGIHICRLIANIQNSL